LTGFGVRRTLMQPRFFKGEQPMRRVLTSLLFVASLTGAASAADYGVAPGYAGWHAMPS
jgi:hypothetical protein